VKSSDKFSVSESNFRKKRRENTKRKTGNLKQDAGNRMPETGNGKPASAAGRPNCLDQEKLARLLEAYYSHPYSFRELADMFGVSRMTVWRAVQETPAIFAGRMV
jgi:transposase